MRMEQGVRTGLGHGASPVSYRHNFLVFFYKLIVSKFIADLKQGFYKQCSHFPSTHIPYVLR